MNFKIFKYLKLKLFRARINKTQKEFVLWLFQITALGLLVPFSTIFINYFIGNKISEDAKLLESILLSVPACVIMTYIYIKLGEIEKKGLAKDD